MKTLFLIFMSIFFLIGCSGRVQTNPEPKKENIFMPKNYKTKTVDSIDERLINDYDNYASKILTNSNASDVEVKRIDQEQQENKQYKVQTNPEPKTTKTLWQVGLDIAKEAKK